MDYEDGRQILACPTKDEFLTWVCVNESTSYFQ
jgi:hypothetical protein